MTTRKLLQKITRPEVSVLCFLCAWFLATVSEASPEMRWYVSTVSGLSCFGASVFHYGANHRVYVRKAERVEVRKPWVLALIGGSAMIAAVLVSLATHNTWCVVAATFNLVIIGLYAPVLSKSWFSKNLVIAVVCTTPAFMGWIVGTTTQPATKYIMTIIFLTFLAREIVKDVIDIKANHGIRVTLPMVIGISGALMIAAVITAVSAITSLLLYPYFWSALIASPVLGYVAWQLVTTKDPHQAKRIIMLSMAVLMLSFL